VPPTMTPTRMTAWLEQAWLIRYLDRQLAGEEADWFEAYALDKPELLAMIEVDTRLRDALAADATMRHRERSVVDESRQGGAAAHSQVNRLHDDAADPTPVHSSASFKADPRRTAPSRRRAPAWLALAASLLIGVSIGWFGTRMPAENAPPAVIASPTRIIYDTMRGEESLPRIEHADSTSPYVLVEAAVPPGAENIALKIGDAAADPLTPSPDGFVSFILQRHTLAGRADTRVEYDLHGKRTKIPIRWKE